MCQQKIWPVPTMPSSDQWSSMLPQLLVASHQHFVKNFKKVQRRCHRLICGLSPGTECDCPMFDSLNLRRNVAALKLFNKATSTDHVLHSLLPNRSERSSRFIQPPAITTRYRTSFIPQATAISNNTFSRTLNLNIVLTKHFPVYAFIVNLISTYIKDYLCPFCVLHY